MIRTRVWLLSVVAALLVAGPAMAYSWPLLFGLPAVFGQDGPRAEVALPPPPSFEQPLPPVPSFEESEHGVKDRFPVSIILPQLFDGPGNNSSCNTQPQVLVQIKETCIPCDYRQLIMPYADHIRSRQASPALSCAEICDPAGNCLVIWRKLWQQGRFREAYGVARCAVESDPQNVEARHALVVSQIVNETSLPNAFRALAQQRCEEFCPAAPAGIQFVRQQPVSGLTPAGTLTPDLRIPLETAACDIDLCCPMIDCPLVTLFNAVFGGSKAAKTSGCGPCPVAHGHRSQGDERCKQAEAEVGGCGMQIVRGPQGPQMIWIVREPTMTVPAFPPAPGPIVSRPAPLPPPYFAPPPPPIMATPEGMVIPVPVVAPYPQHPTGHYGQTLYDPAAEPCEVAPPPLPAMPKHVQITQNSRHVHVSSPNYSAHCERIRGGVNGELILEGNVLLISRRHGQSMTINAQRVLLNVKDEQFVVENADGMNTSRVNIAPVLSTEQPVVESRATRFTAEQIVSSTPTGKVLLANDYGEEMVFVVNQKPMRVAPRSVVALDGVPAGVVEYQVISPTWGMRARNTVNLPANETFTLSAR